MANAPRRLRGLLLLGLLLATVLPLPASAETPDPCQVTGYQAGGRLLSARLVDPEETVTGTVDATGCDIGVYFSSGSTGAVADAEIYGATWYGIVGHGADLTIRDSTIHDIGSKPFDGMQYGVAILVRKGPDGTLPSATIQRNHLSRYQKGGMALFDGDFQVTGNTVDGLGPVAYIAQTGIQLTAGATGTLVNNTITGHWYNGDDWSSTGILLWSSGGVKVTNNRLAENQVGIYLVDVPGAKLTSNRITGSGGDAEGDWSIFLWESDAKLHANKVE